MIVYGNGGRVIGDIDDGIFIKRVDGRKHMLQKPRAWAIDAMAYVHHILPNCRTILIGDDHAKLNYEVSIEIFERHKGYVNRGHGGQFFLTLNHWTCVASGQRRMV